MARHNPMGGSLLLGDRIQIVPYEGSNNIGILEVDHKGHTVRQLAYFDAKTRSWKRAPDEKRWQTATLAVGTAKE